MIGQVFINEMKTYYNKYEGPQIFFIFLKFLLLLLLLLLFMNCIVQKIQEEEILRYFDLAPVFFTSLTKFLQLSTSKSKDTICLIHFTRSVICND